MPTTYQSGKNIAVLYKAQGAKGTAETGAGGFGLRVRPSAGLKLGKGIIQNEAIRGDGQTRRGRHGTRNVSGGLISDLCVGELDNPFQAYLRGTWTAAVDITNATMTSITTTTTDIVAAAGSWLTQGVRIGDMVKLTGHSTVANNGKWFRVLGVTATNITLPTASLTADGVPDASFTLSVAKTLLQADPPTERYFTVEQVEQDIDYSLVNVDCKWNHFEFSAGPDANIGITHAMVGLDQNSATAGGSPGLTSPTWYTSRPLVLGDGKVRIGSSDFVDLSSLSFTFDVPASAPAVMGPNAIDVFMGEAVISGSFTTARSSHVNWSAFDAETPMSIFIEAREIGSEPAAFVSFYLGDVVFDGADAPLGSDGPMIETVPFRAGKDETGIATGHAPTMLKISTSAA